MGGGKPIVIKSVVEWAGDFVEREGRVTGGVEGVFAPFAGAVAALDYGDDFAGSVGGTGSGGGANGMGGDAG